MQLRPVRGARCDIAGLSSLATAMAVSPKLQRLRGARKLATLFEHRAVAMAASAAALTTDLPPTKTSLTPRGTCYGAYMT